MVCLPSLYTRDDVFLPVSSVGSDAVTLTLSFVREMSAQCLPKLSAHASEWPQPLHVHAAEDKAQYAWNSLPGQFARTIQQDNLLGQMARAKQQGSIVLQGPPTFTLPRIPCLSCFLAQLVQTTSPYV